jgi:membrane-associated phospholipid phosphatase
MIKITVAITIALLILVHISIFAQVDSLKTDRGSRNSFPKLLIVPSSLVISGLIIKGTTYRESIQKWVQSSSLKTNNHIDDFIQYAPMAEMFVADIAYSKTKNEVFQQSKNLIISQLFTAFIVQTLKFSTNVTRPNGASHSFPSGHTSVAFTGATALYLEYRDTNPFLAYSGYGFSTATGILRVTNNKHWVSDVLVSAGIGMLSARLTWYINPFKNWKPFKSSKVAIYPYVNGLDSSAGICMVF